jgi:hypothetical protein
MKTRQSLEKGVSAIRIYFCYLSCAYSTFPKLYGKTSGVLPEIFGIFDHTVSQFDANTSSLFESLFQKQRLKDRI